MTDLIKISKFKQSSIIPGAFYIHFIKFYSFVYVCVGVGGSIKIRKTLTTSQISKTSNWTPFASPVLILEYSTKFPYNDVRGE